MSGSRTLRFDTEGSSFDTVLSLHSERPVAKNGNWVTYPARATHQNQHETGATAYFTGSVNGEQAIYEGDTSGMTADVGNAAACGLDSRSSRDGTSRRLS